MIAVIYSRGITDQSADALAVGCIVLWYARHGRELMRLKSSVCEPRYYDSMVAKVLAEGKRLRLAVASQEGDTVRCRLKEAGVQNCEPTNRNVI